MFSESHLNMSTPVLSQRPSSRKLHTWSGTGKQGSNYLLVTCRATASNLTVAPTVVGRC